MPFSTLIPLASTSTSRLLSRPSSPRLPQDVYDLSSSDEEQPSSTQDSPLPASIPMQSSFHHPQPRYADAGYGQAAVSSASSISARPTPIQSRAGSPLPYLPQYFSEDEPPLKIPTQTRFIERYQSSYAPSRRKWWADSTTSKRNRRRTTKMRMWRKALSTLLAHPLFPTQPVTILFTITLIVVFTLLITLSLMYILNPDKMPLPWRSYCSLSPPFDSTQLAGLPPVGIFLGVMSTDSAVERRMLIRSTWAKHVRSRGVSGGTSRTVVRFILGIPRSGWTRRIQLEAETYRDIVLLPISENMNYGKTHAYISWAHSNAFVPPPTTKHSNISSVQNPHAFAASLSPYNTSLFADFPSFNTTHQSVPAPSPAPHDPPLPNSDAPWVRPQYVIKADDDAFVMLAELEARLRLEWYEALSDAADKRTPKHNSSVSTAIPTSNPAQSSLAPSLGPQRMTKLVPRRVIPSGSPFPVTRYEGEESRAPADLDPMIYWGYLVKARFMAGELYALSSSLVEYVATSPTVVTMVRGAEDKQTAKWVRLHPRATEVRWPSERCWIYDHPRAGTVYSHGFLFPSEVARIRHETTHGLTPAQIHLLPTSTSTTDPSLTHSTVSRFGTRYIPPASNLTTDQEVEALIEGSPLSRLRDETITGVPGEATPEEVRRAWRRRESRLKRLGIVDYPSSSSSSSPSGSETDALGGTVVVHFIKRNEWFLETALAFLDDDEDGETRPGQSGSGSGTSSTEKHGDDDNDEEEEDELAWQKIVEEAKAKGTGKYALPSKPNRIETDLSNKTPLDFSNLDDVEVEDVKVEEEKKLVSSGEDASEVVGDLGKVQDTLILQSF